MSPLELLFKAPKDDLEYSESMNLKKNKCAAILLPGISFFQNRLHQLFLPENNIFPLLSFESPSVSIFCTLIDFSWHIDIVILMDDATHQMSSVKHSILQ